MRKAAAWILRIVLAIWQAPQNIAGLAVWLACRTRPGAWTFEWSGPPSSLLPPVHTLVCQSFPGGVSLGSFVVAYSANPLVLYHERGHCIQSLLLGPAYLPVVGLPSLLHRLWHDRHGGADYYGWYCEAWADRLGGIRRDARGARSVAQGPSPRGGAGS